MGNVARGFKGLGEECTPPLPRISPKGIDSKKIKFYYESLRHIGILNWKILFLKSVSVRYEDNFKKFPYLGGSVIFRINISIFRKIKNNDKVKKTIFEIAEPPDGCFLK